MWLVPIDRGNLSHWTSQRTTRNKTRGFGVPVKKYKLDAMSVLERCGGKRFKGKKPTVTYPKYIHKIF
jgi:hypothetical protein